ncbi:MAG: putative toxin-antitoxin system toxin component, PIN family [Isosphaeraceae bacterium]
MAGDQPFLERPVAQVPRVVIDTNVLVAAAYKPESASARVVSACLSGRLQAVVSLDLVREYRHILSKAVANRPWHPTLDQLLASAIRIDPDQTPAVVSADPSDDMLFAAARAGAAEVIVTNDRPVLQVRLHQGVRVVRPPACLEELLGETSV